MEMNPIKVRMVLKNGDDLNGEVNLLHYKRFSDFIETHGAKHIKLFNIIKGNDYSDVLIDFLVIPKDNILYYEPFDKEKKE
jgi:hypothetical protein